MIWGGRSPWERSWDGELRASAHSPGTAAQVGVTTTLPGRKGAPLLLQTQQEPVALGGKLEVFGVGDGQRGGRGSTSSAVGRTRFQPSVRRGLRVPALTSPVHCRVCGPPCAGWERASLSWCAVFFGCRRVLLVSEQCSEALAFFLSVRAGVAAWEGGVLLFFQTCQELLLIKRPFCS